MELTYMKGESKTLRELGYDEKWLHEKIADDPTVLGLGELRIIEHERSQPSGGRIDLLACDDEKDIWYEIEIMLGQLDENHIIRTIEY